MENNKIIIGYTQGVFDLFHIGHLNLLRQAKERCDYLIVGVNSDRLVQEYKNKTPIIKEEERVEIVKNIKCVDDAFVCDSLDKMVAYNNKKFDKIIIGDCWKGDPRWLETEKQMAKVGVEIEYVPYTKGISSTIIRDKLKK